jgi:hypothetical protein
MKSVEYHKHGIREIYSRNNCHSCWDCGYCVDMANPNQYMCRCRGLTSLKNKNFPYDNTKCEEFKQRNDET